MERLRRIQVEGFRSIRALDLELGNVTILLGANGAGKSNFIGFFQMLNNMLSESLQVYVGRRGGGSSILHYGPKKTPVLRASLEFESESATSEYGFALAFASPDGLLFTNEHVGFKRRDADRPFINDLGAGHLETKLIVAAKKRMDEYGRREFASFFVDRLKDLQIYHFHDTSETASIRMSQDISRNRSLLSNGGNLASILYMLRETRPQHFDRIFSLVRLAVPYIKGFILEPDLLDPRRIQLRWRDKNPDYEFGPHQLSDGSLRAIAMITALAQPEEMLPSVVFMDEPELGLHPSAIGIIADLVQEVSLKRQVVIATQSPRFLSKFSPEQVVVVERNEDRQGFGESSYRRLSTEDLSLWLEDYDLGELFEKNVTGGWPQ